MKAPCLHFLLSVCIKASLATVCFKETFHNANLWKVPNSHMPTSLSLSLSLSSTNTPSTIIWHGKTYYSSSTVTADRRSALKTARAENTHSQPKPGDEPHSAQSQTGLQDQVDIREGHLGHSYVFSCLIPHPKCTVPSTPLHSCLSF